MGWFALNVERGSDRLCRWRAGLIVASKAEGQRGMLLRPPHAKPLPKPPVPTRQQQQLVRGPSRRHIEQTRGFLFVITRRRHGFKAWNGYLKRPGFRGGQLV